jgi:hypothetical protein
MYFHATDAVLAISQHPESGHPLIHPERRIFEDRSNLNGELLVASTAEPNAPSLDEVVLIGIAARASDLSIGPAKANRVIKGSLRIGEVNDGFLQGAWRFHETNVRLLFVCVSCFCLMFSNC